MSDVPQDGIEHSADEMVTVRLSEANWHRVSHALTISAETVLERAPDEGPAKECLNIRSEILEQVRAEKYDL